MPQNGKSALKMQIIDDIRRSTPGLPEVAMTIGSFDGVHLGHQQILKAVAREARGLGGTAAVLTMDPHPREVFSPEHAPNLLTTREKKFELFEAAGIDAVFVLPFDTNIARLEPLEFVETIVAGQCGAKALIVGHDFRFGRQAQGDYEYLLGVAPQFGFTVSQVSPLLIAGERVSSTVIRERILQGDMEQAARYLGRPYSVRGQVVPGRGIGKELGFPTANVQPHHSAVPAHGVYAGEVQIAGGRHKAAVNIGIAPTIRNDDPVIEAFILDFERDVLSERIEVTFYKRLRPELKFPSREDLIEQIHRDVETVRMHFAAE